MDTPKSLKNDPSIDVKAHISQSPLHVIKISTLANTMLICQTNKNETFSM